MYFLKHLIRYSYVLFVLEHCVALSIFIQKCDGRFGPFMQTLILQTLDKDRTTPRREVPFIFRAYIVKKM